LNIDKDPADRRADTAEAAHRAHVATSTRHRLTIYFSARSCVTSLTDHVR
jgi:hypothetical protein